MVVSKEPRWRRLVNSIHVLCNVEHFSLHYELSELRNGTVRLLWDGLEFAQHKSAAMGRVNSSDLHIETEGGHTLEVEFWPDGEDSSAVFSALELQMPESFADCQDFKVCLDPLRANDAASKRLRNSNELQLQCLLDELDDDSVRNACALWLGCLSPDVQVSLLGLLRAAVLGEPPVSGPHRRLPLSSTDAPTAAAHAGPSAGPDAGPSTGPSGSTEAVSASASTDPSTDAGETGSSESSLVSLAPDCVDPEIADAQSWNCDCMAEMQWACLRLSSEFSEATCLRAQMCSHDRVCDHWKTAAGCFSGDLFDAQLQLEGMRRLNERASDSAQEAETTLDRVLLAKNCN
jgi:hypothetical protein